MLVRVYCSSPLDFIDSCKLYLNLFLLHLLNVFGAGVCRFANSTDLFGTEQYAEEVCMAMQHS